MNSILEAKSSPLSFFSQLIGIDVDSGVKEFERLFNKQKDVNAPYLRGSISNYTQNLTMTFPVLCDNSLQPETASMISRANERYIVTMLQMLFASAQFNAQDGVDVLSGIHKNLKVSKNLDDYMDAVDNFLDFDESAIFESTDMKEAVKKMEAELKKPMKDFPTDSFSSKSLNDYHVYNFNGKATVKEAAVLNEDLSDFGFTVNKDDGTPIPTAKNGNIYLNTNPTTHFKFFTNSKGEPVDGTGKQDTSEYNKAAKAAFDYAKATSDYNYKAGRDKVMDKYNQDKLGIDRDNLALNRNKDARDRDLHDLRMRQLSNQDLQSQYEVISKRLLDTDIKKANELAPTLLTVNYNVIDNDGTVIGQRAFVAGVKSRLISVDSSDIVERVVAKNKTRLSFLNFIRATTGEIGFMKDFILCLNQAKIDARNSVKKGEAAKVWKTLETLAVKNNRRKLRKSGNDASAITVLVINQETVNLIKRQYDFDLEQVRNAWQIMGDYNLLGIIIADESIEIVKTLYAGHDMWEQQAYSYLEKESNDKSYRKVINLIGQNRRF